MSRVYYNRAGRKTTAPSDNLAPKMSQEGVLCKLTSTHALISLQGLGQTLVYAAAHAFCKTNDSLPGAVDDLMRETSVMLLCECRFEMQPISKKQRIRFSADIEREPDADQFRYEYRATKWTCTGQKAQAVVQATDLIGCAVRCNDYGLFVWNSCLGYVKCKLDMVPVDVNVGCWVQFSARLERTVPHDEWSCTSIRRFTGPIPFDVSVRGPRYETATPLPAVVACVFQADNLAIAWSPVLGRISITPTDSISASAIAQLHGGKSIAVTAGLMEYPRYVDLVWSANYMGAPMSSQLSVLNDYRLITCKARFVSTDYKKGGMAYLTNPDYGNIFMSYVDFVGGGKSCSKLGNLMSKSKMYTVRMVPQQYRKDCCWRALFVRENEDTCAAAASASIKPKQKQMLSYASTSRSSDDQATSSSEIRQPQPLDDRANMTSSTTTNQRRGNGRLAPDPKPTQFDNISEIALTSDELVEFMSVDMDTNEIASSLSVASSSSTSSSSSAAQSSSQISRSNFLPMNDSTLPIAAIDNSTEPTATSLQKTPSFADPDYTRSSIIFPNRSQTTSAGTQTDTASVRDRIFDIVRNDMEMFELLCTKHPLVVREMLD